MSYSSSIATLQSLLRSAAPTPSSSASSSTTTRTDLPSTSNTSYARSYVSPSYWGSTITSAFGYGANQTVSAENGRSGEPFKGKGKARAAIPSWTEEDVEGEAVRGEEGGKEGAEGDGQVDEELERLVGSILWQAGVDNVPNAAHDTVAGPLLVLACSRIPEPASSTSNAKLLEKLRNRLESFASTGSYSIVLLANPTPYPPSTPQLVSAYLTLSRTTRKNLRKLWVVGSGWWTRMVLGLFNTTLLSLKTSKKQKIVQCATLSALAEELGTKCFTSIEFPLEVYVENAKLEEEIALPGGDEKVQPVFGVPLSELCGPDGTTLPPILEDCLEVLETQGPSSLGVFRRSPSASTVKILELAYSRHHPISLSTYPDAPYLSASLLKLFLRSLPTPILPRTIWTISKECPKPPSSASESVSFIREKILPLMIRGGNEGESKAEYEVLRRVVKMLKRIADRKDENLMGSLNLVICLAPCLIGGIIGGGGTGEGASGIKEEIEVCKVPGGTAGDGQGGGGGNTVGGVLKIMIERYEEIFADSSLTLNPSISPPPLPLDDPPSLPTTRPPTSPTRDRTFGRTRAVQGEAERTSVRGIFAPTAAVHE